MRRNLVLLFCLPFVLALFSASMSPLQPSHAQDPTTIAFSLADESFSFEHPAEWTGEYQGSQILLTNNETLLNALYRRQMAEDDVLIFILGATETSVIGIEDQPVETAVQQMSEAVQQQLDISEVVAHELGADQTAYQFNFLNGSTEGLYLIVPASADRTITLIAVASQGFLSQHENTVLEVASSMHYDSTQSNPDLLATTREISFGSADAPITIYEFGTYGCHACRVVHQQGITDDIVSLVEENEGKVRFVFVNFPVISPLNDPFSAEVAQCVVDQSETAYWDYHHAIYDISDGDYTRLGTLDDFVEFATNLDLGLDNEVLQNCVDARTHRGTVQYNLSVASQAGVSGTPTFAINGQAVSPDQIGVQVAIELANLE